MPTVTENVHPSSMDFQNQRRVYLLRTVDKLPWPRILPQVVNLKGEHPSETQCRDVVKKFSLKKGRKVYKYGQCGRKPWKVTRDVEQYLIRRLKQIRKHTVCTSATLQRECLREKRVTLECSTIRKVLQRNGFRWVRRTKKPKYSAQDKAERKQFAEEILEMSPAQVRKHFAMFMDGVVLSLPPADPVDRVNYCRNLETHVWRRRDEAKQEEFEAGSNYDKQIPHGRQVPMWGGIGPGGFGLVMFHEYRKVNQWEWSAAVESRQLQGALQTCRPERKRGPWVILCDNESFLTAPASRKAHEQLRVELYHVPARSPDLNPVEMFWAWLKKRLRKMDLDDLSAGRPPIAKFGLKQRVRALMRKPETKLVAQNCFRKLRSKCVQVVRARGAAIRG